MPPTLTAVPPTQVPRPTATAPGKYAAVTDLRQLIGTWKVAENLFVRFDEDGTFRGAFSLDELETNPFQISACILEGDELVIKEVSVSGIRSCGSKIGRYEVRLLDGGDLQLVLIKDGCAPRVEDTEGLYQRVR